MSDQEITPQEKMQNLLDKYYVHNPSVDEEKELELRYGLGENSITKNQFNNVMNKLKSMGFLLLNTEGDYMLRINPMTRGKSGYFNQSFIRVEINELNNIQKYCKTDYFDTVNLPDHIELIQKRLPIQERVKDPKEPGKLKNIYLKPVDFIDSNFRVNFKLEKKLQPDNKAVLSVLREWPSSKKIYRYLKRYRFKIPNMPFEVHCSIVKTSRQRKRGNRSIYIEENNIQDLRNGMSTRGEQ